MASPRPARAAILGAAGFTGGELIRLLLRHPHIELVAAVSSSHAGLPVCEAHPNLRGRTDMRFSPRIDARGLDAIFLAGGHGQSMSAAPDMLAAAGAKLRLIDLSGDFRLPRPELYEKWYGRGHAAPQLLSRFAYGLTELNRAAIKKSRCVANPGCFATAVCLALGPLARAGLKAAACVTAVTGSSGSGCKPSLLAHHPTRWSNMRAYKPFAHQHVPEIEGLLGRGLSFSLIPVSGPFARGIYAVCQIPRPRSWNEEKLRRLYAAAYKGSPFVRLLSQPPSLNAVLGSNHCDIHATVGDGHIGVVAAIDNLVKGASGQAVQNLNVMLGFDEAAGLDFAGPYP
ncbi:MAG TPA: N-acetyl-gamma-glutamyl-phosphate reductase [Elusimicrobia bacterium]|nr:N-acetyl-gamma-glutamyl-phosphate reductase [Elusimicrobiota bacterium]HBT61103.1 N-acetyl-gamma-glutamyl-phosphate reductase [Elusimicrobiota bacterium]